MSNLLGSILELFILILLGENISVNKGSDM